MLNASYQTLAYYRSKNTASCTYGLADLPSVPEHWQMGMTEPKPSLAWSGKMQVPAVGESVYVLLWNYGLAKVTGYFVEHGWVGLHVDLDKPAKRGPRKGATEALVFGCDLAHADVVA